MLLRPHVPSLSTGPPCPTGPSRHRDAVPGDVCPMTQGWQGTRSWSLRSASPSLGAWELLGHSQPVVVETAVIPALWCSSSLYCPLGLRGEGSPWRSSAAPRGLAVGIPSALSSQLQPIKTAFCNPSPREITHPVLPAPDRGSKKGARFLSPLRSGKAPGHAPPLPLSKAQPGFADCSWPAARPPPGTSRGCSTCVWPPSAS